MLVEYEVHKNDLGKLIIKHKYGHDNNNILYESHNHDEKNSTKACKVSHTR